MRRTEYVVRALEAEDSPALAALHAQEFSRPWSEDEFEVLLLQDTIFGYAAVVSGRPELAPVGFVLARLAAGEAEILTITVAHAQRRTGLGHQLMDAVLRKLYAERAEALFLEVDENNQPAIGLYRRLGFHQVGARPDYYKDRSGQRTGALIMRRDLHQMHPQEKS